MGAKYMLRLDAEAGSVIERLDVDQLLQGPTAHGPASILSIAGTDYAPIIIVCAMPLFGLTYIVAIDLESRSPLWQVPIAYSSIFDMVGNVGQFAALTGPDGPLIVFSTNRIGVFAIGNE